MKQSIITADMEHCYICGKPKECIHHIYPGSRRKTSDEYGFVVPLCHFHHNMSNESVHKNTKLMMFFKRLCQQKFEQQNNREEFIRLIGRNYLED